MVQSVRRLRINPGLKGQSLSEQIGSQRVSDVNVRPTNTGYNVPFNPQDRQPRGMIEDIIPPSDTTHGEYFRVQCIASNAGSIEGQFILRITIPSVNIDTETEPVAIPALTQANIWKKIIMPDDAGSMDELEATATISHLNENEWDHTDEAKIVDDEFDFMIPGPVTPHDYDSEMDDENNNTEPASEPQCFTMTLARLLDIQNTYSGVSFNSIDALVQELNSRNLSINNTAIEWCPDGEESDISVIISGVPYNPGNLHSENDTKQAAITLSPRTAVRDGDLVTVVGMNFAPYENIDIILRMTTSAIDGTSDDTVANYEGQVYTNNKTVTADSGGDFRTTIRTRNIPSGVVGDAIISVTGIRSSKTASKSIQVT